MRFVKRERTENGTWENSRTAVEVATKHCKIYVYTVLWDMRIVGTSMKGKGAKAVKGKRHSNEIIEIDRGVVPRR